MEIPDTVLEVLKCSKCKILLSRSPTYLEHNGAPVCGQCIAPDQPAIRNIQYEAVARLLRFPCKNKDLGCPETIPYIEDNEEIDHEIVCDFRQYVCPLFGSGRCDWIGSSKQMEQHCTTNHPDLVLENPCSLSHDISHSNMDNYLIRAFHLLFLLHTKVCVTTGKIFYAVRLLDITNKISEFFYTLDIKRDDEIIKKKGNVLPQGCMAIQVDTSLALKVNSLLDVLDGWDGTTFILNLKKREPNLKCLKCENNLKKRVYRGFNGWLCSKCIPTQRYCENKVNGCNYEDYSEKCEKHEMNFCEKTTKCLLCFNKISEDNLHSHYHLKHKNRLYSNGSTWKAKLIGDWRKSLISCDFGIAVCWYRLNDSGFNFEVHTPLKSGQLLDYECFVRVKQTFNGESHSYAPDVIFDEDCDWLIHVEKKIFPSWDQKFEFSVTISKIN